MCRRSSSAKNKVPKIFYKKLKSAFNEAVPISRASAERSCVNCSEKDGCHKMKRWRTRKARNQLRDSGKEASNSKPCHHPSSRPISKDISHVHQCRHNSIVTDTFPNIVPAPHEPSVITDSRLIGHHGLFNHEVKSNDIERLLSEVRKLDKSGKMEDKSCVNSHLSAFDNPPSLENKSVSDFTNDKAVTSKEKDQTTTEAFKYSQDQQRKTLQSCSQVSDLTPGQRLKKTINPITESDENNDLSKQNPSDIVIIESKETLPCFSEKNRELHQTPSSYKENVKDLTSQIQGQMPSSLECTPAAQQREVSDQSPLQRSLSLHAEVSDIIEIHQPNLNEEAVAMSVKAVATNLCQGLSFPLLTKRNLVAESREVLLKALRKKHGSQLRRNILKVRQHLHFEGDVQREGQELYQSPIFIDINKPCLSDELTPFFKVTSPCFTTPSFGKNRRLQFNWNSSDWSNQSHETTEWLRSPLENSVGVDGVFSRRCSPPFCMDFDFQNAFSSEQEHLFAPSPTSSSINAASGPCHVGDGFIRPQSKEGGMFESTHSLMNLCDTKETHSSSRLTSDFNTKQNFVSYQVTHRHSAESMLLPEHTTGTYKYTFGNSFSDQIPHYQQRRHVEPFGHYSHPPAYPAFRSHHLDLEHFSPSHMLNRGSTLSRSFSFPSPEQWSFPPMRMY